MKRLLLLFVLMLAGCQSDETKIEAHDRIISLMPSNTEIVYALDSGKDLVGVTTVDDYPADVKSLKKFDNFNLQKEALLKAKPDIILAHESSKNAQEKVLSQLKGVKVIYVKDAKTLDEIDDSINQIAKAIHKEDAADNVIKKLHKDIDKVVKEHPLDGQKVYMEVSSEPEIYTSGSNTLFDDMLKRLGAKNAFSDVEGWQAVSKESIIKRNPDVIIGTTGQSAAEFKEIITNRSGFQSVKAVQNNAVHVVNDDMISRPGPRIAEGLKQLAEAIDK